MTKFSNVAAVVLAAGKGTRLNSKDINKVVLPLAGKPLISYTVAALKAIKPEQLVLVVGFAQESVKAVFGEEVEYAYQKEQLGTAHALESALPYLKSQIQYVLVLYGDDSAFFPDHILRQVVLNTKKQNVVFSFLTLEKEDPRGLGRIVRDKNGDVIAIVEEKNATAQQKKIKEVNVGGFCFKREFLEQNLSKVEPNPVTSERYLTDLVTIAVKNGEKVGTIRITSEDFWHGVNTPQELTGAQKKMSGDL